LINHSVTIERILLQGFRAYLRPQTIELTRKRGHLSLAIFGHNATGKSSLVDAFEYYFSEDATLKRLGKREVHAFAGPKAIEHVNAKDENIESFVHFWFKRNGERFNAKRPAHSSIPDEAKRILSTVRIPFVIRGYELRGFVEDTTPEKQYQELVNWFGLEPLLSIQKNLRTLRKRVKEESESTSEEDERSRDLLRETGGEVARWNDRGLCDWLNGRVLDSLDSSLKFVEISEKDPAFAILNARWKAEQEKLGLTQLRKISRLLEDLASPLDPTDGEKTGKILAFEQAVASVNQAVENERAERIRVRNAVFSQVWKEAKKLLDSVEVLENCPICDANLATGPHGSHGGVRISIDKKLSGLATYRASERLLDASKAQVKRAIDELRHGLEAAAREFDDTPYACVEVSDYLQTLNLWEIDVGLPDSKEVVNALSRVFITIANQIAEIEDQQGEHTYGKALGTVTKLLDIKTELQRIERTKDKLQSIQREINRQVLEIEKAIVSHISGLVSKLESDVASIYQAIQGAGVKSPRIWIDLPDQAGVDQQRARLLMDYSSNRKGVAPSGYLSDSQVHTLALALRLAAIRLFNSDAPIMVLDDVVTSYDADHRKNIVNTLDRHFSEFQIILVTHDEQFFNLLRDQMPQGSWVFKRIMKIQEGIGPVFDDHQTLDEVIQERLDAGENAGAYIRLAQEKWLLQICCDFKTRVTMRPAERARQFDRGELAGSLASYLNGAKLEVPQTPTGPNRFLESLQRGVVENQASHYSDNPYKSSSVGDDLARWQEFKDFRELFGCPYCGKKRFNRQEGKGLPVCNYCQTPFAFSQS